MSLTIRMCAVNKPNLDKVIKNNKRLKTAFHSQKSKRNNHRVAIDELDTFLRSWICRTRRPYASAKFR